MMKFIVEPSRVSGAVPMPASKSHTIRALFLAMMGNGKSEIIAPLRSRDTLAAADACRAFGAKITGDTNWVVKGTGGRPAAAALIDVRNSGTTLPLAMAMAALARGATRLTGDAQIQRRPVRHLANCLEQLGASVTFENGDCPPVVVSGSLQGGRAPLRAPTSQYLTALLIACPFAAADTEIDMLELNEVPYVAMTLGWLDRLALKYENRDMKYFRIPGGQSLCGFSARVPADFSSATFFLAAAAVTGGELFLEGLDMNDAQGDKAVVSMLEKMGAEVEATDKGVRIRGGALRGCDFDLNATPDALPAMAVAGCFAEGTTRLLNVPQARIKETDRIAVMREELTKMGGRVEELADGLIVRGAPLRGAGVSGHDDHRVVMALCVAGLAAEGTTIVDTAEAVDVTFPDFAQLMRDAGARIRG